MTPVHPHYPLAPAAIISTAGTTPPAGLVSSVTSPTTPPVVAGHVQSYVDMYPPTHPLAAPHEDAFQDVRRFGHDQTGLPNGNGSSVAPSTPGSDNVPASGYDPSPHPLHAYMRPHSPRASLGPSVLSTVHEQEVPSQYSFPTGHLPESFETSPIQGPPNFFQSPPNLQLLSDIVSTAFQVLNFNHSVDAEVPCLLELDEDQAQQFNSESGPPDTQELQTDNATTVTNNSYNAGIFASMAPLMDPDNPDQPLPPHEQPALFPHPNPPTTGVFKTIVQFSICISARVAQMEKKIDLVQHTPKRDRGPQIIPEPRSLRGGGNLNVMALNTPQNIVTFERVQFKTATANNGKRRAAQQYYVLQVDLYATTEDGRLYRVASTQSASLVVRGRSPGHYADNHERFSQHASVPTSPTSVGFMDERRLSAGLIQGYPYATTAHHGSHPYRQHPHSRSHSISAGVAAVSLDSTSSPHGGSNGHHSGHVFDASPYGPLSPMSPGATSDYGGGGGGGGRSYYGTPSHSGGGSGGWHESSALSSPSSVYEHAGYSPFASYPPQSSSTSPSGYGGNNHGGGGGPLSPSSSSSYPSSFGSTPQFVMTPDGTTGPGQHGFDARSTSVHPFDSANGPPLTPSHMETAAPQYHGMQEHAQQTFGSSAQSAPLQTMPTGTSYALEGSSEQQASQQQQQQQQQQHHHHQQQQSQQPPQPYAAAGTGYREQDSAQYSTSTSMQDFQQRAPSSTDGSVSLTSSSSSASNYGYSTSTTMTPASTYHPEFAGTHANGTVLTAPPIPVTAAASTIGANGYQMAPPPSSHHHHQHHHHHHSNVVSATSAYSQPPSGPEPSHDSSTPFMAGATMAGPASQVGAMVDHPTMVSERC
ncbi:hypothetical protein DFQ27_001901 [Actinomortierella ambigua]|uniref:NDT80 domain-containing protein n=1 Tax=Actinomortierella ambigua TaxID=1343610 RepID=A0A9P6U6X4_9FUNG|nr:hypothetical protein DFQ27_001901 [Actinomortierella ambigua]